VKFALIVVFEQDNGVAVNALHSIPFVRFAAPMQSLRCYPYLISMRAKTKNPFRVSEEIQRFRAIGG
jgi:hypothetical protein